MVQLCVLPCAHASCPCTENNHPGDLGPPLVHRQAPIGACLQAHKHPPHRVVYAPIMILVRVLQGRQHLVMQLFCVVNVCRQCVCQLLPRDVAVAVRVKVLQTTGSRSNRPQVAEARQRGYIAGQSGNVVRTHRLSTQDRKAVYMPWHRWCNGQQRTANTAGELSCCASALPYDSYAGRRPTCDTRHVSHDSCSSAV